MDNRESELALNILNAVLANEDQYYGSERGILPTPDVPPRKLPRMDAPGEGPAYSWGVVGGGFIPGRPVRGRGGKKIVPQKKKTVPGAKPGTSGDKAKGEKDAKDKEGEKEGGSKAEGAAAGDKAGETGAAKTGAAETEKKKKEECTVPLRYLRCHICQMHKFNNSSVSE
ncbi:hypothetical protein GWK47_013129 [Chionoecetes opilio]|uniref:Uncharacterized protein n=1 Tax=Chionoecetes opilio TaxID=41210 RepID=A0A8J4Y0V6_CHIOP|nr:hypothetical protein GWK47_013129 [Chionoecetes opilio]